MLNPHYHPISANSLFHFTNKLENLNGILAGGFKPRYCLENFNLLMKPGYKPEDRFEWAIPMTCFCDLPLSQTTYHSSIYGNYAIGMSKEWGMKKGITPVLYAYQGSSMIAQIGDFFRHAGEMKSDTKGKERMTLNIHKLLSFVKPYEGDLWRSSGIKENVRFYDEREWRFVANIPSQTMRLFLEKEDFFNEEFKSQCNASVGDQFRLRFQANDIKYLIVPKEKQIVPFIRKLRAKSPLSKDDLNLICSRVISAEQIRTDF